MRSIGGEPDSQAHLPWAHGATKPSGTAQQASCNIENIHLQPFPVNGTKQTVKKNGKHYCKNNNKLNPNAIREQLGICPLGAFWNSGSFSKSDLSATFFLSN